MPAVLLSVHASGVVERACQPCLERACHHCFHGDVNVKLNVRVTR
jgi:hypothetical protein